MSNVTIEDWVRAILAVGVLGVFSYATLSGKADTNPFHDVLLIILGFYFGVNELANVVRSVRTKATNGGNGHAT